MGCTRDPLQADENKVSFYGWTGYGAKEAGGRWNSVGVSMVYVSETASLTMLETLVHLHAAQIMDFFTLLSIDVPDELIQSANMDELPDNWADEDAPQELADYGDASVIYRGARLLCVFPQPYRR